MPANPDPLTAGAPRDVKYDPLIVALIEDALSQLAPVERDQKLMEFLHEEVEGGLDVLFIELCQTIRGYQQNQFERQMHGPVLGYAERILVNIHKQLELAGVEFDGVKLVPISSPNSHSDGWSNR